MPKCSRPSTWALVFAWWFHPEDADRVVEILRANGERAQVIGTVGEFGKREVLVPQKGLTLLPPDA